jgi:predicted HTH domain antitoxin
MTIGRKESLVASRLPAHLVRDLELIEKVEQTDRSSTVRKLLARATREWKLEHYAAEYAAGRMSVAKSAQEAAVSVWEMMEYLRAHKVPAQYDHDELQRDLETLRRLPRGKASRRPGPAATG